MVNMKKQDYSSPYGFWKVTTEGDCEGRSTRQLGIHAGFIDDIALALADQCCYSLTFTKVDPYYLKHMPPKANKVDVTLDIDSGTWNMDKAQRVAFMEQMLKGRNVRVSEGKSYASVTISTNRKTQEELRQEILAKLTDEEKAILGLEV